MKLPLLFLILQVTDELKRMNHQDESRWPRQAATGAWSSRKCEYLSPVLHKRYQIWVISAISDGRCSNNQTSGEQGSATKHKGSVWAEELAAEDVAAAGPQVGRQFPELNPGFPSSLWTDISWCISFRSLWTTASPAQRHGLCTFIQANFSAAFTEEQQEAPWLETWLKRQKGTEVTAAIPSGYRAASFFKCTSRRVIRLQMTITNRRACYIG